MPDAKTEVLRYLGYRGQELTPEIDGLLESCMLDIRDCASPRHVRRTFDLKAASEGILLGGSGIILCGQSIRKHLAGCCQVVLLAATLGVQADNLIRRAERSDVTRALILDACATQYIEQYCDEIDAEIALEAQEGGLCATLRFSPGYGDFPLDIQPKLLAALNAERRIGLTCTQRHILLPRKSVTALIGIGEHVRENKNGCDACPMRHSCGAAKNTKAPERKDSDF